MDILYPTPATIAQACASLRAGNLVAFPTETVYGLGADASSETALKRLYEAKGRPGDHPVIVHLAAFEQLYDWAAEVPEGVKLLAYRFCPGPLTFILPKAKRVLPQITGGQDTVGLRFPSHPVAQQLLAGFRGGLAAPSANKFGRLSPTTVQDVVLEFGDEVSLVLDGGPSQVGIESTIIDFTVNPARILRPGIIPASQIEAVLGTSLAKPTASASGTRAPGMLESHYAPTTRVEMVEAPLLQGRLQTLSGSGKRAAVLAFQAATDLRSAVKLIVASAEPARYAHELYRNLRELDYVKADVILVETVPDQENWAGVADRLRRASAKT
jgi:L-threonylcarbamoyladenylate synthase